MAQVKIFALREHLDPIKANLSDVIHACLVDVLKLPENKRFHRFFSLEREDFYFPADRSSHYTIIEISMFEGRASETKKKLLQQLFARLQSELHIDPQDVEITIFETPPANWGIRGQSGDDLQLNYKVNV